jgi:hypothetical protein
VDPSDGDGGTGGIGIEPPPTSTADARDSHPFWLILVVLATLSGAAIVSARMPESRRSR